jgi:hypothetical protein
MTNFYVKQIIVVSLPNALLLSYKTNQIKKIFYFILFYNFVLV